MRLVAKFLGYFVQALFKGEPWAFWFLAVVAAIALIWGFSKLIRRPLGGNPEKTPLYDELLDDKNPYRQNI